MFTDSEKDRHSIRDLCRVLEVSPSGYYAYKSRPDCARRLQDNELKDVISQIFVANRSVYGVRRITACLARQDIHISHRRCARLMRELGICGISKRKSRPKAKVTQPPVPQVSDLVRRDFSAHDPNRLWFADITYVKTYEGWLYLAVVFDVFSRLVVGWSMQDSMTAALVDDALKMAISRRHPAPGLIHHSDHGSQYCSLLLGKTLRESGITPSMGAISAPGDNAITESLMSTIKAECTDIKTYQSRRQAVLDIFDYIEVFYNKLRIHSSIGMLSPVEFEERYYQDLAKAS